LLTRVNLEAAGAVEVDRLAPPLTTLTDVMRVRLGIQMPKERQCDVDAVEEITLSWPLAPALGRNVSCGHDARDELLQVAVILLDGRRWISVCDKPLWISVDCLSTRVLAAVTCDRFRDAAHPSLTSAALS